MEQALHGTEHCTEQSAAQNRVLPAWDTRALLQCNGTEHYSAAEQSTAQNLALLGTEQRITMEHLQLAGTGRCIAKEQSTARIGARMECCSDRSAAQNGVLLGMEHCSERSAAVCSATEQSTARNTALVDCTFRGILRCAHCSICRCISATLWALLRPSPQTSN